MGKSCFAENHDLFYHDGCLAKRTRDIFIMMFSDCDIDQKISPSIMILVPSKRSLNLP